MTCINMRDTSWGSVAAWYDDHLGSEDTYHAQVIAPNLLRLVAPRPGTRLLDIGCGEGYFTRLFSHAGADATGADISEELIAKAQEKGGASYVVASADKMPFAADVGIDVVTAVLTLQNMERIEPVFKEVARVLKPDGRFVFVLNHPAFRIPKRSSWGWDEQQLMQYRRIDRYLSSATEKIDMTPGKGRSVYTYSFHRSLQDYMKAARGAGFAFTRLEEWISHRTSEPGPRKAAEDLARKEIPLFLAIEARIVTQ